MLISEFDSIIISVLSIIFVILLVIALRLKFKNPAYKESQSINEYLSMYLKNFKKGITSVNSQDINPCNTSINPISDKIREFIERLNFLEEISSQGKNTFGQIFPYR